MRARLTVWLVLLVLLTMGPVGYLRLRDLDPDATFSPVTWVIAYAPALAAFAAAGIVGGPSEVVALLTLSSQAVVAAGYVVVAVGLLLFRIRAPERLVRGAQHDEGRH